MGHNEGPAFQEKLAAACWLGQRTDAELASFGLGSEALCAALLEEQGVASTPGTDFEDSERGKTREHIMYGPATNKWQGVPREGRNDGILLRGSIRHSHIPIVHECFALHIQAVASDVYVSVFLETRLKLL